MPLAGGWSGCRCKHVKLEPVRYVHFPGDQEVRDSVHARLAKKLAAREVHKAMKEQSAGGSAAAPGTGEQAN